MCHFLTFHVNFRPSALKLDMLQSNFRVETATEKLLPYRERSPLSSYRLVRMVWLHPYRAVGLL
jgi:hypothetical protein